MRFSVYSPFSRISQFFAPCKQKLVCVCYSAAFKHEEIYSVAHLVVLIIEKQEEIHSFIVFQRILTEEGFG